MPSNRKEHVWGPTKIILHLSVNNKMINSITNKSCASTNKTVKSSRTCRQAMLRQSGQDRMVPWQSGKLVRTDLTGTGHTFILPLLSLTSHKTHHIWDRGNTDLFLFLFFSFIGCLLIILKGKVVNGTK